VSPPPPSSPSQHSFEQLRRWCCRSGGGYQYRLCPLEKMPCTESGEMIGRLGFLWVLSKRCSRPTDFQRMPLDFVRGSQAIMWNNGSLYNISHAAKYVDDSVCPVVPQGSTWARNPIPRIHTDNIGMAFVGKCLPQGGPNACKQQGAGWCWAKDDCQQFPNPCPGLDEGWYGPGANATHMPTGSFAPDSNKHEGWCSGDWTLGMVSDQIHIPKTLKPGRYVMSWRMDCEETAQVSGVSSPTLLMSRKCGVHRTACGIYIIY
jgi:hypothetical protein